MNEERDKIRRKFMQYGIEHPLVQSTAQRTTCNGFEGKNTCVTTLQVEDDEVTIGKEKKTAA